MTDVWGPPAWKFLHAVTNSYPDSPTEQNKQDMRTFFISLKNILPCIKCQNNYAEHLKVLPLTEDILSSRGSLSQWLIDIHNMVNVSTGKKVWNPQKSGVTVINFIIVGIVLLLLIAVGISIKQLVEQAKRSP